MESLPHRFVPSKFLPEGFEGARRIIHGSRVVIDEDDSCQFMWCH